MTTVKDCCADGNNLEQRPTDRPDMTLKVCKVCSARHFELEVDPVPMGVRN